MVQRLCLWSFKKVIGMWKISGWQVAFVTQRLFKHTFPGGLRTLGVLATPVGAESGSIRVLMEQHAG